MVSFPDSLAKVEGFALFLSVLSGIHVAPESVNVSMEGAMPEIPESVKQFVATHIHSIDVVEVLLLLRRESPKEWDASAVSKALWLERSGVEAILEQLSGAGLLKSGNDGAPRSHRYSPASPEAVHAVNELAKWYLANPVAIVALVFSNRAQHFRTASKPQ
jgi:hypothetical protein